jgi:hypothetical protein
VQISASKKRRAKKPLTAATVDLVKPQQKRAKNLYSPGLRLSISRGRGRGGASRGRGRKFVKKETSSCATLNIDFEGNKVDYDNFFTMEDASISIGMKDSTHLQGCGGWPKSAARTQ